MQTKVNQCLILENDHFKEVMFEAKELMNKAQRYKYNLMHDQSFEYYNFWAPYVLNDIPSDFVNSPGYKIAFLQVMSILMAMKGEQAHHKTQKIKNDTNIINFLSYKASKIDYNIYNKNKG